MNKHFDINPLSVPLWAKTVAVECGEGELVISGFGVYNAPLDTQSIKEEGLEDLLGLYYRCENVQPNPKCPTGGSSPHSEFANANTDDKLIAFVRRYGPVAAYYRPGLEPETGDVFEALDFPESVVVQDMNVLRAEQKIFTLVCDVVSGTNKARPLITERREIVPERRTASKVIHSPRQVDRLKKWRAKWQPACRDIQGSLVALAAAIQTLRDCQKSLYEKLEVSPWLHVIVDSSLAEDLASEDFRRVVIRADRTLCKIFNSFRTYLYADGGGAIELPEITHLGILPSLYFMLRDNYRRNRHFELCAKDGCGNLFLANGPKALHCSDRCSHAVSQQKHWKKTGKRKREQARKLQKKSSVAKGS